MCAYVYANACAVLLETRCAFVTVIVSLRPLDPPSSTLSNMRTVGRDTWSMAMSRWKCKLFSELGTQGSESVYYFRNGNFKDLEMYTNSATENPRTWKCILFSELNTKGLGSAYYFWN